VVTPSNLTAESVPCIGVFSSCNLVAGEEIAFAFEAIKDAVATPTGIKNFFFMIFTPTINIIKLARDYYKINKELHPYLNCLKTMIYY
jgi:hypothetical protein